MADAICRWRNGTPKTVVELVNSIPHTKMTIDVFRSYMENRWGGDFFRTPYQLACQLGLYCEAEDGYYYPRFDHDIDEKEAEDYLFFWLPRYYIPNPYTRKDGFQSIDCPTYFLKELYNYTRQNPNCTYKEAYESCFHETAKNNDDIIRNYINSFSRVLSFSRDGVLNITSINPTIVFNNMDRNDKKAFFNNFEMNPSNSYKTDNINNIYRPYITAIKSKPFLLLAGISGTGKSRIVRELARACWTEGSKEYKDPKPRNFEMVQVKPNWHDSSELIGYVSRVSGSPVFVAGDFLKFVAKAWENPEVPYFLCLDEMNLAPVEQYFAEYLSVVESRKCQEDGTIATDPILKKSKEDWYRVLTAELTDDENIRKRFLNDGICIPQNLIVVGTVNMDETTFSFSRKVLDRAMTIEMNEVDLYGGLDSQYEKIGKLEAGNLIGTAVEGVDVYKENKEVCDIALKYLEAVNTELEGTPFKVAYRTRNEFLLYVVNNLPYNKDKDGNELEPNFVIARALDEITSMKILSRIEGDSDKIGNLLNNLQNVIKEQLKAISNKEYCDKKDEGEKEYSVSLAKLAEMEKRLKSGYTSFWS